MNDRPVASNWSIMLYGLLPLLVLADSFFSGIVFGISFLFCYLITTLFYLFTKRKKLQMTSWITLIIILSICLSVILSIVRIINPFLFELVFPQICIIPITPVLFQIDGMQAQKDPERGLTDLILGVLFSMLIIFVGFFREFLVSFSILELFANHEKTVPFLPIFNQPAGAFLLIGLAAGIIGYFKQKAGSKDD